MNKPRTFSMKPTTVEHYDLFVNGQTAYDTHDVGGLSHIATITIAGGMVSIKPNGGEATNSSCRLPLDMFLAAADLIKERK